MSLMRITPKITYSRYGKRILDIVLTIQALIVLAPLMAIIAVLVRLNLGNPVIFRQQRLGLNGKPFTIYKYRTMSEVIGPDGTPLPDAARLTKLGKMLRTYSLDELPELWNVLKGEMSLVGPRPLLLRYAPYFRPAELARFTTRPGITGLSQIHGRNELSWVLRLAKDIEYVRRCSLWLDIYIMSLTLWNVPMKKGFAVDPNASMLDLDQERQTKIT